MATSSSTTTTTISQLSCFSSLNSRLHHLHRRSILSLPESPRYKSWVVMSIEGHNNEAQTSTSNIKTSSTNHNYTAPEEYEGISDQVKGVYGSARIHDFCFGIPFGGVVLSGGLLGFVFSRNAVTLGTDVLFGGALLALSTFSLKIWRQGKSSLPFVLGQAVLTAALCWNNFRAYSLTKKVIPTGFFAVISAAMLCFYSYVMISGGNPPPKKLQESAGVNS
ncbi:PREDICTED: uncharacterized protein LOC105121547 [Populus euphratica]|uniref:Uncharacterized protein LOC105121547 n=1 Tax=Populus euphratica TaxID=75702 RepID=A0AAJ6TVS1_POPEU|nr:PREDICTED: uncharacterized protein LOC105121547 [Populus euphratica]